jgi:hypothetical protein
VKTQVLTLVGGSLIFAGAVVFVSTLLWPDAPIPLYSSVALGLCLVPTLATLVWAGWGLTGSPEQQLLTLFGGMGLRMVLVLGLGLTLYYLVSTFQRTTFWIVILIFYLFTLGLEIVLLLSLKEQRK